MAKLRGPREVIFDYIAATVRPSGESIPSIPSYSRDGLFMYRRCTRTLLNESHAGTVELKGNAKKTCTIVRK